MIFSLFQDISQWVNTHELGLGFVEKNKKPLYIYLINIFKKLNNYVFSIAY